MRCIDAYLLLIIILYSGCLRRACGHHHIKIHHIRTYFRWNNRLLGVGNASKYEDVGEEGKFDVYFMHGDDYIYIVVEVTDSTQHDDDWMNVFFDEGDDGGYGSGSGDMVLKENQEDVKGIKGDGELWDGCFSTHKEQLKWWSCSEEYYPDEIDFEAEIAYHSDHWEAEFKIPFKGQEGKEHDYSDLNIDMGDTIGIVLSHYDANIDDWFIYPSGSSSNDASTYLALSFKNLPPPPSGTPGFPLEFILLGVLLTAIALVLFRKKSRTPTT